MFILIAKLFLVLQLVSTGNVAGISHGCPARWKSFGDLCYLKVHTAMTWPEASYHCRRYGGQLARIESKEVNSFLLNKFLKTGKHPHWFGLHRCGGNKWCFPDWEIASSFSNWNKDEPNNSNGYEGCVDIRTDGYWNDRGCHIQKLPYICQRKKGNMAATINLKILGKEHGMILQELNNTKQEIKNVLKQLLNIGQRKLGFFENPGKSCLDILTRTTKPKGLSSGEYWIRIDSNGPLKVFCDMKTDGGGWTMITNVILQDSNGFSWSLATDYRKISEYKSNKLGASTQALGALKRNMPFTQLRFYCHKKTPGRTVDIVTEKNNLGQDVVSYFTGKSATFPKACGSFSPLPDDNSLLARECGKWGYQGGKYFIGKWSHDGIGLDQRLYNHAFFIGFKAHWIVPFSQGGRWECDDYGLSRSAGDFWKIYVR